MFIIGISLLLFCILPVSPFTLNPARVTKFSYRQNDVLQEANPTITKAPDVGFNSKRQTIIDAQRAFGSTSLVADGRYCGFNYGMFIFK